LVKDFSLVGEGFCLDESNNLYSCIYSAVLPLSTTDTYCLSWCSENPHPDFVGVEVDKYSYGLFCYCLFSGVVPQDDIDLSDYHPEAGGYDFDYPGVGAIQTADESYDTVCYRYDKYKKSFASTVRIELGSGLNIQLFEVQVYSSGMNVATGKSSSQSSTLNNFDASLAVDGKANTFSHTNVATSGSPVWWKVDLGNEFPVESVTVLNRWCVSSLDPSGCLCHLSYASLFLIDSNGIVVGTQSFGNTCGKQNISFDIFSVPSV